jgi:DNA repair protein RadD
LLRNRGPPPPVWCYSAASATAAFYLAGLISDIDLNCFVLWQCDLCLYATLDPENRAGNKKHEARKGDAFGGPKLLECSECHALREGGKACPNCGFIPQRKPDIIIPKEGHLARVAADKRPGKAEVDERNWHAMLAGIAAERGYKPGWAAHQHKEKFGHRPPRGHVTPKSPTPEVRSWVRSRQIAYAKSQGPRL